MVSCCQREGIERQFGRRTAQWELRRFRKRGPAKTTRMLIEALQREGVAGARILDVGGGVGAIYHALLAAGARNAIHVDVSPDYLNVAREEAERRGHADRVELVHADFVEVAPTQDEADIVTLDRVICCYPEMERLVMLSADKARRLYGAVYPRESWWLRLALAGVNLTSRIRRCGFRTYLHAPAAIDRVLRARGLARRSFQQTLAWEVAVYSR
jgi:SAM-dependent methyltransferase